MRGKGVHLPPVVVVVFPALAVVEAYPAVQKIMYIIISISRPKGCSYHAGALCVWLPVNDSYAMIVSVEIHFAERTCYKAA